MTSSKKGTQTICQNKTSSYPKEDESISFPGEENEESLHIKNKGAHGSAWEKTRPAFLKEYGFDPNFFQQYKVQRKQAEKEFLDWKKERSKKNKSRTLMKYSTSNQGNLDLWRRLNLDDDE